MRYGRNEPEARGVCSHRPSFHDLGIAIQKLIASFAHVRIEMHHIGKVRPSQEPDRLSSRLMARDESPGRERIVPAGDRPLLFNEINPKLPQAFAQKGVRGPTAALESLHGINDILTAPPVNPPSLPGEEQLMTHFRAFSPYDCALRTTNAVGWTNA